MRIVLKKIIDSDSFSEALEKCEGTVELHTREGDCLNLRSHLSRIITLNVIFGGVEEIDNAEIYIEKDSDAAHLMEYVAGKTDG